MWFWLIEEVESVRRFLGLGGDVLVALSQGDDFRGVFDYLKTITGGLVSDARLRAQ